MEPSRHWRLQKQRYCLVGEECDKCGKRLFPPRPVCYHNPHPATQELVSSNKENPQAERTKTEIALDATEKIGDRTNGRSIREMAPFTVVEPTE